MCAAVWSGYEDPWVVVPHELNVVRRQVLAHDRPPVVAGGVVPLVRVQVTLRVPAAQHSHARLLEKYFDATKKYLRCTYYRN